MAHKKRASLCAWRSSLRRELSGMANVRPGAQSESLSTELEARSFEEAWRSTQEPLRSYFSLILGQQTGNSLQKRKSITKKYFVCPYIVIE